MTRRPSVSRRRFGIAAGAGALVLGCKRRRAPEIAEVWDEQPGSGQTEALASLAPPWPAPVRGRLGSGLLTFWLEEADAPALHVRALLPTAGGDRPPLSADAIAVVTEHLGFELQRRLHRDGIAVETEHGPDRIELSLHGNADDLARMLKWLGWALRPAAPLAGLSRARDRLRGQLPPASTEDVAVAHLVGAMLGRPGANERVDASRLEGLTRDDLEDAWSGLTDPRQAVLLVHAGTPADRARAELRQLSAAWHGLGKRTSPAAAVGRLHVDISAPAPDQRLLAQPAAAIEVTSAGRGEPTLVAGRVIDTPTADTRSLARLAQRIIQEELDARLVISGQHALFLVRTSLSRSAPERSAQSLVDDLAQLAATRQPAQRLFQASQLWLGARVVEASLRGEDWTRLFAEAIDLAGDDEEIAGALTRDARAMLEPDPAVLRTWQQQWLDPRAGTTGWHWMAAGVDASAQRRLERIAPVRTLG
jgi:hypothetical protein